MSFTECSNIAEPQEKTNSNESLTAIPTKDR